MTKDPLNIALRFLKFRPRSVFEIKERLKRERFDQKEIDGVIRVMTENKLLDDAEFAKMYVRDRNLLKPTGAYLLKIELKRLGLSENDIEEAMKDQDEEELAHRALESKSRLVNVDFAKKAKFLERRGFNTGLIYKILK